MTKNDRREQQHLQAPSPDQVNLLALLLLWLMTWQWLLPAAANSETTSHATTHPNLILADYRFNRASQRTRLPKELREVSGLAVLNASAVALHTDNSALVWTFDLAREQLGNQMLVDSPIPGDFEGIAALDDFLLLADSHGSISRFAHRPPAVEVARNRTQYHPQFKEHCVFEGLAVAPPTSAEHSSIGSQTRILLPCKYPRFEEAGKPAAKDHLIYIFAQPLTATNEVDVDAGFTVIAIDVSKILRQRGLRRLRPSAIEVVDDHLLILAGKERVLLETSLSGNLLAWRKLAWPRHRQAEGLALMPDGALVIADEGRWLGGTITIYEPSKPRTRK